MKLGLRVRSIALFRQLGPGLVTGAADDDPSGIATYSQAGAQFGFGLLWTMLLTYPLMAAVQLVSAHIGSKQPMRMTAGATMIEPDPDEAIVSQPGHVDPLSAIQRPCCGSQLRSFVHVN